MRNKRFNIFKVIFIIYIIGLCFCCFWNFRGSIDLGDDWWGLPKDKVLHFMLFFPFPFIAYMAFPKVSDTARKYLKFSILIFVAGAATGALIEIVQGWSGYRSCDMLDLAADCCGLAAAIVCLQTYEAFFRKRRKSEK